MHWERRTWVYWDINSCPVPDGYDARMVRQCIESAVKKAGYSGPLSIIAIGNLNVTLKQTPDVLPAIFSSGILLKHVLSGFRNISRNLLALAFGYHAPANIMLISGADAYATTISSTFSELERRGRHTTLLAYPRQANFPLFHSPFGSWEDLLKDAMDPGETRRQELHEKCCETGGSAWLCTLCQILPLSAMQNLPLSQYAESLILKGRGNRFEDFTTHLKSRDHALKELDQLNHVPRPLTVKKQSKKRSFEEEEEEEEYEWDRITV